MPVKGKILLDNGAVDAITNKHKSLFGPGIKKVAGNFSSEEGISLCNLDGMEFARGLANYSSEEIKKLAGIHSNEYQTVLGYHGRNEVVHRKNIAILLESELFPELGHDNNGHTTNGIPNGVEVH